MTGDNISAAYDYAPFGQATASSGPAADLTPVRFSSEVWDGTLGLVYYNWRHYNPLDGRFTSRDPIGERGGLNLYGFVGNDPVNSWDYVGLLSISPVDDSPRVSGSVEKIYASAFIIFDGQDIAMLASAGGGTLIHSKRVSITLRHCNKPITLRESQAVNKRISITGTGSAVNPMNEFSDKDYNSRIYFNLMNKSIPEDYKAGCAKGRIEVNSYWMLVPRGGNVGGKGNRVDDHLASSDDSYSNHGPIYAYDGWIKPRTDYRSSTGWFNFTIQMRCGGGPDIVPIIVPLYP